MLLLYALLFAVGLEPSNGTCSADGVTPWVGQLSRTVEEVADSCPPFALPEGYIQRVDLVEALDAVRASNPTVCDLFAALADGQRRVLEGADLAWFLRENGMELGILPLDELRSVEANGADVTLKFDFEGGARRRNVELPEGRVAVYNEASGSVEWRQVGGHTLSVAETVNLTVSEEGITGINKGDIKVPWGILSFNLSLSTQCEDSLRDATEAGMPLIRLNEDGQPLVENGSYVREQYDSWAIIEAGGNRSEQGVPHLGQ
jgi:hypothetical protein